MTHGSEKMNMKQKQRLPENIIQVRGGDMDLNLDGGSDEKGQIVEHWNNKA